MRYHLSYMDTQNAKVRKANKEGYRDLGLAAFVAVFGSMFFILGLAV